MFTASLNLEALQQTIQGAGRTCAAEGCAQPAPQESEYCADHSKRRGEKRRRAKKSRR